MKKLKLLNCALALSLGAALLLTGCGGDPDPSESVSPSEQVLDESTGYDYSKYNTYLDLNNEMYDIEDVLDVYFRNVDYTKDFALVEGGDYAALKDVLETYTPTTHIAQKALGYVEDKPAYPDVDELVKKLDTSVEEVMTALNHIGSYVRFDEFTEDDLAKAPELHAELWSALEVYDLYYMDFMDAMSALSEQLDEQYLEQLWNSGDLVLYYSECMIGSAQDALGEIMDQLNAAIDSGAEGLPELEMSKLGDYFNQFNEHYNTLKTTLENTEEREKVPSLAGSRGEGILKLYTNKMDTLYYYMGLLAEDVNNNVDYLDALYDAMDAHDAMIDAYNSII